MPVRVVGFDGDDTLWHSETRFHVTQGEFRELLKRHVPDADVDARLAETEMKNLAIYGYGVKSFTLSMLETAMELTEQRIPTADLDVILGWGKRMLMEPTELLRGVEETLRSLSGRYDLDRKSTRLNSSHPSISYAVFCLKKKTKKTTNA